MDDNAIQLQGWIKIWKKIAANNEGQTYTHKEVRALGRFCLNILAHLNLSSGVHAEIAVYLTGLSAPRLPHYDRAFLAQQVVDLLVAEQDKLIHEISHF